jgi:arsenate reductase-like glutaredoxin family protein
MNIQIFGKAKCFDTKKAERYFKERKIPFQPVDVLRYPLKGREFESVKAALHGIEAMIDPASKDPALTLLRYLSREEDKEEKLKENPQLLKTPIVRNGKEATAGYCPEIWKDWK